MKIRLIGRVLATGTVAIGLLASATPTSAAPIDQPSSPVTPNIVGGRDATEPYPGMISVLFDSTGAGQVYGHTCGATLRDPWHVRTNAHCVTSFPDAAAYDAGRLRVRAGSHDHASGGVVVNVTKVQVHAEWDWGTGSDRLADVALLELSRPIWLFPFITAPASAVRDGKPARLLGWGSTKPSGEGPLPTTLQELDTRLLPASDCAAGGIGEGEICLAAPGGTSGACYGDSGGPALRRVAGMWLAIGSASRETDPTCGRGPNIYTDLTYYEDWFTQVDRTGTVPPRTTPADNTPSAATRTLRWTSAA
ncbi:trypsin-like serine protease [Micromonospora rifamycinica]|uniref:S1 family peptidase n=1 Tax=Micromonospora rifamycinica TaxID=291594 RepID=UPI002E2B9B40|nr:trypsin-like serine protease [Micromonospora rifamycinica]